MKCVLIITGDPKDFGNGHAVRMRHLALELKRRQITAVHTTAPPGATLEMPVDVAVCLLDRRDTDFNPISQASAFTRIAIDNRGKARTAADLAIDILPHLDMTGVSYRNSLGDILLTPELSRFPQQTHLARIRLHESRQAAEAYADFLPVSGTLAPKAFLQQLMAAKRPAVYFGQTLFEALYAGKDVQLYPVSEYHRQLSQDLCDRLSADANLLTALDGSGLKRLADCVQSEFKKHQD